MFCDDSSDSSLLFESSSSSSNSTSESKEDTTINKASRIGDVYRWNYKIHRFTNLD